MSRAGMPAGFLAELAGKVVRPVWFVRLVLPSQTYAQHDGFPGRAYTVDSVEYTNDKLIMEPPEIDESVSSEGHRASTLRVAATAALVDTLRSDAIHQGTIEVRLGMRLEGGALIGGAALAFNPARISGADIVIGAPSSVTLHALPFSADGEVAQPVVASDAAQQDRFPGDTGCAYTARIEGQVIIWMDAPVNTVSHGGGGSGAGQFIQLPRQDDRTGEWRPT